MKSSIPMVLLLVCMISAHNVMAAPTLTSPKVTPSIGDVDTTFTFTVHYRGAKPSLMEVVIDSVPHQMFDVDTSDDNTTDGKDYYFEAVLPEGTAIYFFKAIIGPETTIRTTASTLTVKASAPIHLHHLDLIIASLFFLVPITVALFMFRRLNKNFKEFLEKED